MASNQVPVSPSPAVRIIEVGPRDGLQNIVQSVPTSAKVELITRLHAAGLQNIELTSAVSPKAIPQLADNKKLLSDPSIKALIAQSDLRLPVLVPNTKGLDIAVQHGVKEVAVFVSASEGFSRANTNCTVAEGLQRAHSVADAAKKLGLQVRGYVSTIFACPYSGPTPPSAVLSCVRQLLAMGCYEVSLGDTTGVGAPHDVRALLTYLFAHPDIRPDVLAGHFHDTHGQAVANVWQAYLCGLRAFDSSVAGLGGCPFAGPGAKGNVATEDVVYLFRRAGVSTGGVDLGRVAETGAWVAREVLGRGYECRAGGAVLLAAASASLGGKEEGGGKKLLDGRREREDGRIGPPAEQRILWEEHSGGTDGLKLYRSGASLKIVLDRPKNGNALTTPMIAELTRTFQTAASDPSISRVAITGNGKFFCTGMDLGKGTTPVSRSEDQSKAQFKRLTELFETIDTCPKVTVACLNGPAFGGGVGLAFACDVRIAARDARVTLSEVKLGLCPATISKYVAREWGPAFTREAMLTGRPISPSELKAVGAITGVVEEREQLDEALDRYLLRLKTSAPRASTLCKQLVRLSAEDCGGEAQSRGIATAFDEMMGRESEAAFGVREFQAGQRNVDWDKYVNSKTRSRL
ncbi:Hydroxymethylglutaryl-CoA lyase [Lasiodiplodia hormozganensis]|uniref:hydroxymethylglutaryl-CoA lyase n=1 Tax=Lasiodiplodia hormozganensis TaxID=869390 RepID=A0AA39Y7N7_9PEZI|nr:Hydroxymethylglutaryl-CoA lyase [Lasiodiplodia hormozganensis]